ncbi:MAG: hypothetical protein HYX34_00090 [Actinobacteria bacterium]|nr:hypothetical protein [Actinomycetota bacterium]
MHRPCPPSRYTTTYDYDDSGNQTYTRDPWGNLRTAEFSPANEQTKATDALSKVTTYTRDVGGRTVRVTDPLGRSTRTTFDLAGRPTAVAYFDRNGVAARAVARAAGPYGAPIAGPDRQHQTPHREWVLSRRRHLS